MPGQEAGPKVGGRRLLLEGLAVVGDELVVALLAFDPLELLYSDNERVSLGLG